MPLVKCISCGNEVEKKAKTCPSCGVKHPGVTKRDKIIPAIVMIVVVLGIAQCTSNANHEKEVRYEARLSEARDQFNANPEAFEKKIVALLANDQSKDAELAVWYAGKALPNNERIIQLHNLVVADKEERLAKLAAQEKQVANADRDPCGRTRVDACRMFQTSRSACATAGNLENCMTIKYAEQTMHNTHGSNCDSMWAADRLICN